MILPEFISIHTIVCPACQIEQTGIIKFFMDEGKATMFTAIVCCVTSCRYLIQNDELTKVLE